MIRLAPLITADVDTTTLPGGKASDAAQDFLALLSEALAGETTTDKAAPPSCWWQQISPRQKASRWSARFLPMRNKRIY